MFDSTPKKRVANYFIIGLMLFISACAGIKERITKEYQPVQYDDFILIRAGETDSLTSLAQTYLKDASAAWSIAEFNHIEQVTSGQELVIPLKPFRLGGIRHDGYQTVPVLLYHRFSKNSKTKMIVPESAFEVQMRYLKENGYHILTLGQFLEFLDYKSQIPPKSVLLTFDDGWRTVYDIAFPILKYYGFTGTLFVYTDLIGTKHALSWDQIMELMHYGFDIQNHSKTHRNMTEIKKKESFEKYFEAIEKEISTTNDMILNKLSQQCDAFAYPYGDANSLVTALVQKKGFRAAFTVDRGSNPFFIDNCRIHRCAIYGEYGIKEFEKNLETFKHIESERVLQIPNIDPTTPLTERLKMLASAHEQVRDYDLAIRYREIVNILERNSPESSTALNDLKATARSESDRTYIKAVEYLEKNSIESAQKEFLNVLRYRADHPEALFFLKNRFTEPIYASYRVKSGDNLKSIARHIYNDPDKDFIVAFFNDVPSGTKLDPDTILNLPVIPKKKTPDTPDIENQLEKAQKLLQAKQFEKALAITDTILDKDYLNEEASKLNNAAYYQKAIILMNDKQYQQSLAMFNQVEPEYPGIEEAISNLKTLMKKEAENHYREGVKYFVEEQLELAIKAFEATLAIDPDHENAAKDLENARNLIEKLKLVK